MHKIAAVFFFLLIFTTSAWAQKNTLQPIGTWTNEDKEARFEIFNCGEKLCGKIAWLKEPMRNGKLKTDDNNPDLKLRNRPIQNMVFLKDFTYTGDNKWENGSIYDPKSGKTYSCYIKMLDKNKMEVKGYIGISLIGRAQTWTRVQ